MSLVPYTGMSDFLYELQLIGYMTPMTGCIYTYEYPIDRKIGLSSAFAFSNASGSHVNQFIGLKA